jgi:hypothetical protein
MSSNWQDVTFGRFSEDRLISYHNAGFFSCCSVLLHLIVHYINVYKRLPKFLDTSHTFHWYKKEGVPGDIFPEYFSCNGELQVEYTRDICYHENHQFFDFAKLDWEKLVPLIQKYFNPSPEIQSIMDELVRKYAINYNKTCVLFLRGNDKSTECSIPDYDFYRKAGANILEKEPDIRFMIQSDETEFIDLMTAELGNSFYCKDEIRHIQKSNTTVDIVHKPTNHEFSKKFLAIVMIMAKCKYVVCNYGNCSIWIALFRGNVDNLIEYFV